MMENKACIECIWYKLNKENKTAMVTSSDNKEEKYQEEVVATDLVMMMVLPTMTITKLYTNKAM